MSFFFFWHSLSNQTLNRMISNVFHGLMAEHPKCFAVINTMIKKATYGRKNLFGVIVPEG